MPGQRAPLILENGKNRQAKPDDGLLGYRRYYEQDVEPDGPRFKGDIWLDTVSGIRYDWYVGLSRSCWVQWTK